MEWIQYHLELQLLNCFFDLEESRHGQHLLVGSWRILEIYASCCRSPPPPHLFETMQPVLCVKISKDSFMVSENVN